MLLDDAGWRGAGVQHGRVVRRVARHAARTTALRPGFRAAGGNVSTPVRSRTTMGSSKKPTEDAVVDLDLNPDGTVKLHPLTGYTTGPVADVAILLKPVWASRPEHIPNGDQSVQLVLTPAQALDLAEKLQNLAQRLLSQRPSSPVN